MSRITRPASGRHQTVVLRHIGGEPSVLVPELTGAIELSITDDSTASAIVVVDQLLAGSDPGATEGERSIPETVDLTAADRDRVLVAAYRATFGDRVQASPLCTCCAARYDLDFSLGALADSLYAGLDEPGRTGTPIRTGAGHTVRLPVGRDEVAVRDIDDNRRAFALLDRCIDPPMAPGVDAELLLAEAEEILAAVAPTVDHVLTATCPECGASQAVRFDAQPYVLGLIVAGRERVLREVHLLASTYCWTNEAILDLPRSDRSTLARLVETDEAPRGRR
jgi:hypothetical protein